MSERPIDIHNPIAEYIFDQWKQIPTSKYSASELYKCSKCFDMEIMYKWNLGMCPEELCGLLNCRPEHKNGIQAHLAADATPKQGGIAFYTNTGENTCFYYRACFSELGIIINEARPTEFEMINLLLALFIFKKEILIHKTVRIIVDNNYLRANGKQQRHGLTEAIAAILESCDNSGCKINELFISNKDSDEPFLKVADRLSRNKMLSEWLKEKHSFSDNWRYVTSCRYREIPESRKDSVTLNVVAAINGILKGTRDTFTPESWSPYTCKRLERMMARLHAVPEIEYWEPIHYVPSLPLSFLKKPEESDWSWTKFILLCLCSLFFYKFFFAK